MPQRCGICGKTEKQHKGRACFDMEGFARLLELRKALEKAKAEGPKKDHAALEDK